jgi:hypothetical protein
MMGKPILKWTGPELAERARKWGLSGEDVADCCGVSLADVEWIFWGGDKPPLRMAVFFTLFSSASLSSRAAAIRAMRDASLDRRARYVTTEWRTIPDCSRYQVSDDGRVRRAARGPGAMPGLDLKPTPTAGGHLNITVYRDDGQQWRAGVHQLVALAFIGPPPEGMIVLHDDGDGHNNRPGNLKYGTHLDNAADRKRHAANGVRRNGRVVENPGNGKEATLAQIRRSNKIKMLARLARLENAQR